MRMGIVTPNDANILRTAIFCLILGLSVPLSFAAKDPWVEEMKNAVGLSVGDLTPIDVERDKPDTGQEEKPGSEADVLKPLTPDALNPDTQPEVAEKIREWLSIAQPPANAVPGNKYYYDKFGRRLGSGAGVKTVQSGTHDSVAYGAGATPEAKAWSLRKGLDSIDHCLLEEYVLAKLKNESISHCKGRYGGVRNLKGERLSKAKNAVENAGLKPAISIGSRAKSRQVEGTIERQEPDWKKPLKKGATITLFVHSSYVPSGSTLPDFKGKSLKEAIQWLKDNKFQVGLKPGTRATSPGLSGAVEAQDPAAGTTLIKGAKVDLTVHSPFVDVRKVPNVEGLTVREAKNKLAGMGLKAALKPGTPAKTKKQAGTVESQKPGPGTDVGRGTSVSLKIHSDHIVIRKVPNTSGLTISRAKSLIANAGLEAVLMPGGAPTSKEQAGTVERQKPEPGTKVSPDSNVKIYIYGPYVDTATVPSVKNLPYLAAKRKIESAGLKFEREDGGRPKDRSMAKKAKSQNPDPGTQTSKGSTVRVWFYSDFIAKKIPPQKKKDADAPTVEEGIENRLIGSQWVLWEMTSLNPVCYRQRAGRIKFMKDGNKIIARVAEQEPTGLPVGSKYYELAKKVDSNTFIARHYRTGSKPPFLVFLKFPIIKSKIHLVQYRISNQNEWRSALKIFNKDPWKYNSSPWNRADIRPKCLKSGARTDDIQAPPEDPIGGGGTLGQ